jgi:thioredoxin-like negative regulator of GroEL
VSAQPVEIAPPPERSAERPKLVFFSSPTSGRSRRVEAWLAQVLQRRGNHTTFDIQRLDIERAAEIAERLEVTVSPSLVVVEDGRVVARLDRPTGCREIADVLSPWLR